MLCCGECIVYRGFSTGLYTTNSAEACHYILENARCQIVVVENDIQLQKILQIKDRLPKLHIIQYKGVPPEDPDILSVCLFLFILRHKICNLRRLYVYMYFYCQQYLLLNFTIVETAIVAQIYNWMNEHSLT